MEEFVVNTGIPAAVILTLVAAGLAFLFSVIQSLMSPKQAIKSIIAIALLVGIIFFVYTTASGDIAGTVFERATYADVTPNLLKYVTTGIVVSLVLIAVAVVSWVVLELINLVR